MAHMITGSMLYDLVQCPKRVEQDLFGDASTRDALSPFVQMLWRRGAEWEEQVIAGLQDALDLSRAPAGEREARTLAAMRERTPLIYGGQISAGDQLGIPDLLRLDDEGYVPVDIKSGRGEEGGGDGEGEGRPKLHYAVQLALYVDVLEQLGHSGGRRGAILDRQLNEVPYDLNAPRTKTAKTSLWEDYSAVLVEAREIVCEQRKPLPAASASCKLCHWRSACRQQLDACDDLTRIAGLGRGLRDTLAGSISTVAALAAADLDPFMDGKKTRFSGVGPDRLRLFQLRAQLLTDPKASPILRAEVALPTSQVEFFFDIEVDPLRDFTYLHGVVERRDGDNATEVFHAFFTEEETPEAERHAFSQAYALLTSEPDATIWYYSKYERTIYRELQRRYPDVCSADDIERLFDPARAVDLFNDVILKATEWPTQDQSIKTLAKYLGFAWRDTDPSGAASIEWFDRWVRDRDPSLRSRILEYNEDDCRATRVVLDGIRAMKGRA